MKKASKIVICTLFTIDSFFVSYAIGLNSRHVLVVDPSLAANNKALPTKSLLPTGQTNGANSRVAPAKTTANSKNFTDLSSTPTRLQGSLTKAANAGILDPTTDKKFRPNDPVTRADFTRWMVRVRQIPSATPSEGTYADVDAQNPYYSDIEGATNAMMVQGYAVKGEQQKAFKPEQFITRQEFAVMYGTFSGKRGRAEGLNKEDIDKYLGYNPSTSAFGGLSYKDVGDVDDWARKWLAVAHQAGVLEQCFDVNPYSNTEEKKYLHPQQKMTRAEAVNILVKLYGLQSRTAVQ